MREIVATSVQVEVANTPAGAPAGAPFALEVALMISSVRRAIGALRPARMAMFSASSSHVPVEHHAWRETGRAHRRSRR